jgi:hypothetical protein
LKFLPKARDHKYRFFVRFWIFTTVLIPTSNMIV